MEHLIVAAASIENYIGQADRSIEAMKRWVAAAKEKSAELVLFPELNVNGYIPTPVAHEIAETVPGPSTAKIVALAQEADVIIAYGIIERQGHDLFCTHVLVNGQGVLGKQRKIHVPAHEQPYWKAGDVIEVFDIGKAEEGNDEALIVAELDPAELEDRRSHPNFLAQELRPELYQFDQERGSKK